MQLRSLDLSGTQASDCLLLWLAQRGCGRLQKLLVTNTLVTGAWGPAWLLGSDIVMAVSSWVCRQLYADENSAGRAGSAPGSCLLASGASGLALIAGRGLAALLLAKRALLHHGRSGSGTASSASTGAPAGTEVLPLLELGIAGTPACGAAEEACYVPRHWAEAVMVR